MNIKTKIKNDLWRFNYIVPFVKKELAQKNKMNTAKKIVSAYWTISPVKGKEQKRSVGGNIRELLKQVIVEVNENSRFVYFIDTGKTIAVPGNIISNFTLDYSKIINGTFDSLAAEAVKEDDYGREAGYVAEGIRILRDRILEAIPDSRLPREDKERLSQQFKDIFSKKAEHFDEALQRILFFNQILWQTRHRLNGLGRLDLMLDTLYRQDLESGYFTKQDIKDILNDFLSQLSRYSSFKSDALEGDIGQIIILGGLNVDGTYFCNDLTYMFLKAQARSQKPDPKTFLRLSAKMPDALLQCAVECLASKTGSPLFSNDDVVIPALMEGGIRKEDAFHYCTSACWEPFIVGKSFDQNNIAVFDFSCGLENLLDTVGYEQCESFEQLLDSYIERNNKCFLDFLERIDEIKWAKDPLVSMFTEPCNRNRQDVSEGGAAYSNYGITTVGLANVIDSLFFLKKYVYDRKKTSIQALDAVRKKNYRKNDTVYKVMQNERHSYGHDIPEVIDAVNLITKGMSDLAISHKNKLGGTVKFGLSSPAYIMSGCKASADFSGRKKGMPYSTHISCMDSAYTEIVNFAAQLDYSGQRYNGNVVDFFLSPDFLNQNSEKFTMFLKLAVEVGFFQMQMNVMDSKTLMDAKEHPEQYAGLIVRVWGFSAYFNDLPESYQDLLIERALAAEHVS